MSWYQPRAWLPRFGSPLTSRPSSASSATATSTQPISPSDYNYISPEELEDEVHHPHHSYGGKPRQPSDAHMHMHRAGHKESDALLLRHKRVTYPLHFPPYSVDDGILTVGDIRRDAARTLDRDPRRLKLLYKGKNLDDDARRCVDVGLSSYGQPELLCVVSDSVIGEPSAGGEGSDEVDASDDDEDDADGAPSDRRKRKNRNRKARRRKGGEEPASPSSPRSHASVPRAGNVEHLPIPSGTHPVHRTTSGRSPSPASAASGPSASGTASPARPTPTTPAGKLEVLRNKLGSELIPLAESFIATPPKEKATRDYEYKKLTETILTQVLMKTDEVETDDPGIRAKRKELVKDCQSWLNKLDAAKDRS